MKLDLHIHSVYSRDGASTPEQIVHRCKALGLDGLAVTDHNAIVGSFETVELARQEGLIAVRGVEVSTKEGHILAYGVTELVPRDLPIQQTIDRIHAAGGVAVAAHPLRFPSGIGMEAASNSSFDAIEVLNGGNSRRSNRLALRLAEKLARPVTAGSDAHKIDEVGKAYVVIDGASSEADVLEAIRRGRVRVGGRSRTLEEGVIYSVETLIEWFRRSFRRL
jgi:predicted metal-dependent phosphoesterase TrpH